MKNISQLIKERNSRTFKGIKSKYELDLCISVKTIILSAYYVIFLCSMIWRCSLC